MIFLTVVALSVLVDCIVSGKFSIYANMISYLESVDRGLALDMVHVNSGERFASHDDIFDCRGSKRSGRLYCEWQIQHLCQHDFIFRISR